MKRILLAGLSAAMLLCASGKQNPTPPNTAEVAVSSQTVPAGGTAQVRFTLTEPQPITSTGAGYAMDAMSVDGVALWSPTGDAGGVGVVRNGKLYVSAISPSGNLGMGLDYPFLTITTDLAPTLTVGTSWTTTLDSSSSIATAAGPMNLLMKPGKMTVGGSISIHGVYPGGGTWPAGTLVKILGTGFSNRTKVVTKFKTSTIIFASATEIDLILQAVTTLDTQPIVVTNPDNSTATYFSYLRGVLVNQPSRDVLRKAEPAFPQLTHALASLVVPATSSTQFTALALQNPNTGPLVVTFELDSAAGGSTVTSVILPSGGRVMDDLSSLLGGATVNAGDTVKLMSTAPLQILGLHGDDNAFTLTPFFPTF